MNEGLAAVTEIDNRQLGGRRLRETATIDCACVCAQFGMKVFREKFQIEHLFKVSY